MYIGANVTRAIHVTLTVWTSQLQTMAEAMPGQALIQPCRATRTWIEVVLVDADDNPVPNARYALRLPDQSVRVGALDSNGSVRFDGIVAGQASISFPDIDAREWEPA